MHCNATHTRVEITNIMYQDYKYRYINMILHLRKFYRNYICLRCSLLTTIRYVDSTYLHKT